MPPVCSNCGASDFVWANDLRTGGAIGGGTLSLRARGELSLGTRICRACGHADLFLKDPSVLKAPHTWKPGEFVPIQTRAEPTSAHPAGHGAHAGHVPPSPTPPQSPMPAPPAPMPAPMPLEPPTPPLSDAAPPPPAEPAMPAGAPAPETLEAPPPPPPADEPAPKKSRRRSSKAKTADPAAPE